MPTAKNWGPPQGKTIKPWSFGPDGERPTDAPTNAPPVAPPTAAPPTPPVDALAAAIAEAERLKAEQEAAAKKIASLQKLKAEQTRRAATANLAANRETAIRESSVSQAHDQPLAQ
jgi:hypothetical protein